MLHRVLQEIEAAPGSINLNELSRKLSIERSALDGMIAYWVRKGRLKNDINEQAACSLASCSSGKSCGSPQGCPFVMQMPQTYTLRKPTDK